MQRLLIMGAGFAGMYAAISAARLRRLQGESPDDLEIALISPGPFLRRRSGAGYGALGFLGAG